MLYYHRIDLSKRIDLTKNKNSKEYIFYHHFNHGFKYQKYVYNGCHNLLMLCFNISDITTITVKGIKFRCIIHDIGKSDVIYLLENSLLDYHGYM